MNARTIQYFMSVMVMSVVLISPAFATSWQSIPAGSRLEFIVNYEGTGTTGQFTTFDVQMEFDPLAPAPSALHVTVETASATIHSTEIDEAMAESTWFNTAEFSTAEFHSNNIRLAHGSEFIVEGLLSIKGVSKPVTIPIRWIRQSEGAEISGSLTLSRTDFGIGTGEWEDDSAIGHAVQVHFQVTLSTQQ